jgi:uncharacterized cupredoxin-like copper-binding protein
VTIPARTALPIATIAAIVTLAAGCEPASAPATPAITPGTAASPREVTIIARDYSYQPDPVDLVPGETVLLHVVNAGLDVHEVVIGDADTQDAWEVAEAATIGAPPGPTPAVSVPPGLEGLRIVVESGERVDAGWTVPAAAAAGPPLIVGCHIPGHWEKGMHVPIRLVAEGAVVRFDSPPRAALSMEVEEAVE